MVSKILYAVLILVGTWLIGRILAGLIRNIDIPEVRKDPDRERRPL